MDGTKLKFAFLVCQCFSVVMHAGGFVFLLPGSVAQDVFLLTLTSGFSLDVVWLASLTWFRVAFVLWFGRWSILNSGRLSFSETAKPISYNAESTGFNPSSFCLEFCGIQDLPGGLGSFSHGCLFPEFGRICDEMVFWCFPFLLFFFRILCANSQNNTTENTHSRNPHKNKNSRLLLSHFFVLYAMISAEAKVCDYNNHTTDVFALNISPRPLRLQFFYLPGPVESWKACNKMHRLHEVQRRKAGSTNQNAYQQQHTIQHVWTFTKKVSAGFGCLCSTQVQQFSQVLSLRQSLDTIRLGDTFRQRCVSYRRTVSSSAESASSAPIKLKSYVSSYSSSYSFLNSCKFTCFSVELE